MVDCARMLSLSDPRWETMTAGYKVPFDPRPLLQKLETGQNSAKTWEELWTELYHQVDLGDASFAAIPHLVRICGKRKTIDWNTYAIVTIIEVACGKGVNPDVPKWLKEDYFRAIQKLAQKGTKEILRTDNADEIRAILSVIAIAKGLRIIGRILVNYSEEELLELESRL